MNEITKIWLTWIINRTLGFVGPVLMTYGFSYSDSTAELLAGSIITAFTVWVSHRNMKKAIEANKDEPTNDKAGSIPVSLIIVPLLCLPLVGCASFTEQQFTDAASKPANQAAGRLILTQAGKVAVSQLVDRIDREAFKTQLRSWGSAVNKLLSTGEPITADDLAGIFSTFDSKLDSEKFAKQFGDVTLVIRDYLGEIKNSRVEVIRQWAVVLAQSAEAAGS